MRLWALNPFKGFYIDVPTNYFVTQNLEPLSAHVQDYSLQLSGREEKYHGAFRRHLRDSGVPVESSKGEAGPGQQELNVCYADALVMADRTAVYKQCIKEVADQVGVCRCGEGSERGSCSFNRLIRCPQLGIAVTFMAKPVFGQNGSSCHIHVSLWNADGSSAFYDPAYDVIPCCFCCFSGPWLY